MSRPVGSLEHGRIFEPRSAKDETLANHRARSHRGPADREVTRPSPSVPGRPVVIGFTFGGRRPKVVLVEDENVVVPVAHQGRRH